MEAERLELKESEFWDMTPAQFDRRRERYQERRRVLARLACGIGAAMGGSSVDDIWMIVAGEHPPVAGKQGAPPVMSGQELYLEESHRRAEEVRRKRRAEEFARWRREHS